MPSKKLQYWKMKWNNCEYNQDKNKLYNRVLYILKCYTRAQTTPLGILNIGAITSLNEKYGRKYTQDILEVIKPYIDGADRTLPYIMSVRHQKLEVLNLLYMSINKISKRLGDDHLLNQNGDFYAVVTLILNELDFNVTLKLSLREIIMQVEGLQRNTEAVGRHLETFRHLVEKNVFLNKKYSHLLNLVSIYRKERVTGSHLEIENKLAQSIMATILYQKLNVPQDIKSEKHEMLDSFCETYFNRTYNNKTTDILIWTTIGLIQKSLSPNLISTILNYTISHNASDAEEDVFKDYSNLISNVHKRLPAST